MLQRTAEKTQGIHRQELYRLLEAFQKSPGCVVQLAEDVGDGGHSHHHWELMLPRPNLRAEFTAAILNPPGVRHLGLRDIPNHGGLSCQIRPNYFTCRFRRRIFTPPVRSGNLNNLLIQYFVLFAKAVEEGASEELLSSLSRSLIAMLIFFLKEIDAKHYPPQRVRTSQLAVNYIWEHAVDANLTVEQVAAAFGVTPPHLARLFQSEIKTTVRQFIVDARLQLARELLKDGEYSVACIAAMTGWSSPGYFTRVFKQRHGETPSEFTRKAHAVRTFSRRLADRTT
ncbi:MAG: helix-turn-helix transcriptional regulator [Victivallaceae bacterium]